MGSNFKQVTTIFGDEKKVKEEIKIIRFVKNQEPPYVKMYLHDLERIKELPLKSHNLMYELVVAMNFNGEIIVNKWLKDKISKKYDLSLGSISNMLTKLIKKNVIARIATGTYLMNPDLFAQGSWNDITKLKEEFELTIKYDKKGKRILKGLEV